VLLKNQNARLSRIIIIEIMSFNHHYPCSEVWAQGDLRRASCVAALRTDGQHVVPLWLS
jgi:hypothetical protein